MSKLINCLVSFDMSVGEYVLVEICANKEECERRGNELRPADSKYPIVFEETQEWLIELLLRARLGQLYDVLMRLENTQSPSNIAEKEEGGVA